MAHDLRPFGIAEVEVVGDGDGIGAYGRQVAPGLGHGLLASLVGVVLDVAGGAVRGDRQGLARAVHPHDAGVGAGGAVLQGVGHDVAVVLLPQPALGGHVRAGQQRQHRRFPVGRGGDAGGVQAGLQGRLHPGPVIERRVVGQRAQWQVADHLALVFQHDVAGVGGVADDGGVQAPLLEDAVTVGLAAGLQDGQHPLLALREHHLVGAHALFTLGHGVQVELDADTALAGHLHGGRSETRRAHVLDGGHRAAGHQLQRRLDQQLLGEGVAHLDRGAFLVAVLVELGRGHGGPVDAVAPGLGAEIDHRQVRPRGGGVEDLVGVGQAHAHGVDQDVAVVAAVEVGLAGHGGHADAVAVAADPGDDAGDQALGLRMVDIAKAQRVQQGHRPRAHGEDVAHDAAHARRRALVGFDEAGMIVAFHLEDAGLAVADVHHPGVLAGTLDHPWPLRGELGQVLATGLVGAVLGPHHREHAQFDHVRLPVQAPDDQVVLLGLQAEFEGRFGHGLGRAHGALLAGFGDGGDRAGRAWNLQFRAPVIPVSSHYRRRDNGAKDMGNQSDKRPPQQKANPQRQAPGQQHQQQQGSQSGQQRMPQGDQSRRDDRR